MKYTERRFFAVHVRACIASMLTGIRLLLCIVLSVSCCATAAGSALYGIRLPEKPKPYERMAADELKSYLDRIVKGSFSVGGNTGVVFHVGDTAFAAAKGYLSDRMPDERWMVKSYGRDVILNGGGTRGALYAVSHFLEDRCGVRWWSPQEEHVPETSSLALAGIDDSGCPAFRMRNIYRAFYEKNLPMFAVRKRLNGSDSAGGIAGPQYGGTIRYGAPNHCHTFDYYLPAATYFKDHPEWYSIDSHTGRRTAGKHGQLCLTNPEMRAEVKRRLKGFIKADRAASAKRGIPPPSIYDISENDNWNYCACTNCTAAKKRWNMSGLMLDFVNEIALSVRDAYPDVLVNTFAYHATETPPKGGKRAASNVMVRLCDTKSNQAAGMFEKGNTVFRDFLAAWSKAADNLSVWDYAITYTRELTGLPFPSEFHYADYFRECHARGVYGFFWEHEFAHKADMWELKYHLETRLMEDPYLDGDELIRSFMDEYYGAAGKKVLEYRKLLDAARRSRNGKVGWFPALSDFDWITQDDVTAGNRILADAEKAVEGVEPFASRVRRVRVGLDRLLCLRSRSSTGQVSSEVIAARNRLKSFWPRWMMRYPGITALKADNEVVAAIGLPPPKKFKGRVIHDFTSSFIIPGSGLEKTVFIVDDPESEAGRAVRIDADGSSRFDFPYTIGLYDRRERKVVVEKTFLQPLSKKGYAWYRIGEATIPEDSSIWLTGMWEPSLWMKNQKALHGRNFEMYVSMKFSGKKYRAGSDEPSRIWIDRVVLAVPEKKKGNPADSISSAATRDL